MPQAEHPGVAASEAPARQLSSTEVAQSAADFTHQAEKLSHEQPDAQSPNMAVEAQFVTPQDPVIVTQDGGRLPGVPLQEAHKLNVLREELHGTPETVLIKEGDQTKEEVTNTGPGSPAERRKVIQLPKRRNGKSIQQSGAGDGTLRRQMPPSHTNPLFPPLPLYGPPSRLRDLQCVFFRVSAFFLSLAFLGAIVLGALFTSMPIVSKKLFYKLKGRNLDEKRPFYHEEMRRAAIRREKSNCWKRRASTEALQSDPENNAEDFPPTEGGHDPIVCDVGYYARRVGLDVEAFKVQTEDGFIIDLWHVYDPKEYTEVDEAERQERGPTVFQSSKKKRRYPDRKRKFPVLLMHGLLQSSGAYCCNDDDSLAFWLCKSGYDVWLGNNRCGFEPAHVLLQPGDPRMWCWNIRQMGVFDLPALTSRVLFETGFEKIGLVCHSQGTTEAFVALAKEQRPDLGEKLTVFCALAPAAYAGPLIGKMYFKFMRVISPVVFRLMFGIHAFIPFMMQMHQLLPPRVYGWLGYKVFSFLFNWSDTRWDRGLRDRMFQFAPVYVSAESMRWWLGRECFAKHKCILATKEVTRAEERVDSEVDNSGGRTAENGDPADIAEQQQPQQHNHHHHHNAHQRGATAWYNHQVPPFALWVCEEDDLVDGKKLLRRFAAGGREPHVRVVHSKVIPGYEHLDVIWAMDAPAQVFGELREVLWKTCDARGVCRVPEGCEHVVDEPREGLSAAEAAEGASALPRGDGLDGQESSESSSLSEE